MMKGTPLGIAEKMAGGTTKLREEQEKPAIITHLQINVKIM